MGRPMRPLESAAGPLSVFAAGLRELREQAGSPPFRELARRAHYSATTLSVACSGTTLPTLEVTLAFVEACGGASEEWQERWITIAAALAETGPRPQAAKPGQPDAGRLRRIWRHVAARPAVRRALLAVTSAGVALAVAGLLGAYSPAVPGSPGFGVSPCDQGSYWVRKAPVTVSRPVVLGGRSVRAGTLVGTVYLMYAPHCAEGWVHFSTAAAFDRWPGSVTIVARSVPDNSVTTSTVGTIRNADGEPMLTVSGCVDAEATVSAPGGAPVATGVTGCFEFAN